MEAAHGYGGGDFQAVHLPAYYIIGVSPGEDVLAFEKFDRNKRDGNDDYGVQPCFDLFPHFYSLSFMMNASGKLLRIFGRALAASSRVGYCPM